MENHHLSWGNSLFPWPCSISLVTNQQSDKHYSNCSHVFRCVVRAWLFPRGARCGAAARPVSFSWHPSAFIVATWHSGKSQHGWVHLSAGSQDQNIEGARGQVSIFHHRKTIGKPKEHDGFLYGILWDLPSGNDEQFANWKMTQ